MHPFRILPHAAVAAGALVVALSVSAATGSPRADDPPAAADPHAADREALGAIKALYERAAAEGSPELLRELLAPGFTAVMVTGDEVTTFDELSAFWQRVRAMIGEGGRYGVEVLVDRPVEFDGRIALATGRTRERVTTSGGATYEVEGRFTAVFVRALDSWNLLRIHGSIDPIGNPFVIAAMRPVLWTGAVAGGAGGVAVGALLGFLLGRRRAARTAG